MSWRTTDIFFVMAGATAGIRFTWPAGSSDRGPQWAMGHPLAGEPEVWLTTERVGKKLRCELAVVGSDPEPHDLGCVETKDDYDYRVFVRNEGAQGCRFRLEGGRAD